MSLWGAVPLHPQREEDAGVCQRSLLGKQGRHLWKVVCWWPPSSQEGEPAIEKIAQRHLGRCGKARKIEPCLTAPTAVTPASTTLLLLANRYPLPPLPSTHALPFDFPGVVEEGQAPLSCPGSSGGEGSSSWQELSSYTEVQVVKPSHPITKASLSKRYHSSLSLRFPP